MAEIRDAYVKRNVLESGMQNETAFYNLFRIIAGQSGNLLNVNELSLTLRIKSETVTNYLTILQNGNEVDFVLPYLEKPYAIEVKYDEALIKVPHF